MGWNKSSNQQKRKKSKYEQILFLASFYIVSLISAQTHPSVKYAQSITNKELKELLYVYASDFFAGREAGTKGQKLAVDFLKDYYISLGIDPAIGTSPSYFQKMKLLIDRKIINTENVAAIIPGSEKAEEYIVITSHLDHIGIHDGEVNNGADDDGSGTVAMLRDSRGIANWPMIKVLEDQKNDSISACNCAEEEGLIGLCILCTENPLYPLRRQTVANLNIDMIGRTDPLHGQIKTRITSILIGC